MSDQANAVAPEDQMLDFLGDDEEPEIEQEEQETEVEDSEESEAEETEEVAAEKEPEPEFLELTYNGEQVKKTKDEVIALAQQGFDYTQKTQQLAEERRAIQANAQAVTQQLQLQAAVTDKLAEAKAIESQLAQYQQIDWHTLRAQDPHQAMQLEWQMRDLQQGYQAKVNEINDTARQAEARSHALREESLARERQSLLNAVPEWADGEKYQAEWSQIKSSLKKIGYTDDELAGMMDHRLYVAARKIMLYDKMQESKPEIIKRVAEAPKPAKPGVPQQRNPKGEAYAKHRENLKKTGRTDAAAAALERLL